MKFEIEIAMPASIQEVFDVMSQIDRWLPKVDPAVRIDRGDDQDPLQKGSFFVEHLKAGGGEKAFQVEVIVHERPTRSGARFSGSMMSGEAVYQFSEAGEETRVRLSMWANPRGLWWLAYPILVVATPKNERLRLQKLKESWAEISAETLG